MGPQFIVSPERLDLKIEPGKLGLRGQHANHCAIASPFMMMILVLR